MVPSTSRSLRLGLEDQLALSSGGSYDVGQVTLLRVAKTVVVSFKTSTGAIFEVHRQPYNIVGVRATDSGRLKVDATAKIGRKQDPTKQGRRVMK